ncbi:hypothetical protein [Mesorhizobium sp. ES1-4]|uniref:hypothetical protein n=1 Tax=Mesorhizobium sp. ES1-4 TaxID=2876627 RepID=UPI001CC9DFA2|nr:hypothetical protein [Mesorhizobium sp. ES1-4]MBZ9796673.1 hypothetical protein [Mesorhizobium sp. ES1-4]
MNRWACQSGRFGVAASRALRNPGMDPALFNRIGLSDSDEQSMLASKLPEPLPVGRAYVLMKVR